MDTPHYYFIKCKDNQERRFYILATKKFGWTSRVLSHQIDNQTFEKYLLNQTNFDETLPDRYKNQAILAVKDHYNFDFLELADQHSEFELESALIKNIQKFLLELGSDFAFMGHQFKVPVDGEDYKIDLLLFHRRLQSLIAIDLKIGIFKPEYKGKMEFYLNILNDTVKLSNENDAIGITICREKNRTVVEYSLKNTIHPIGIATYSLTSTLPERLKQFLPDAKRIAEKVDAFFTFDKVNDPSV